MSPATRPAGWRRGTRRPPTPVATGRTGPLLPAAPTPTSAGSAPAALPAAPPLAAPRPTGTLFRDRPAFAGEEGLEVGEPPAVGSRDEARGTDRAVAKEGLHERGARDGERQPHAGVPPRPHAVGQVAGVLGLREGKVRDLAHRAQIRSRIAGSFLGQLTHRGHRVGRRDEAPMT